ncbi:MAG: PDZ domain-containing protein [Tissierellia bacterium]|nr:PDZ domain-containing protein [Tissierellia bacterium]
MDENRNFNNDDFIENPKEYEEHVVEEPDEVEASEEESFHEDEFTTEKIESEEYIIPNDIYIGREDKGEEENQAKEKKRKSFRGSLISYIALALVASLVGGIASIYLAPMLYGKILPNPNTSQYVSTTPININTNDDINTVAAVAKKAMSSVVGITTVEVQQLPFPFFSSQEVEGVGSGVIVDSNGYILTNSHVVADGNAKSVNVLFENGEKKPGTVLWNDSLLDLAIVKVDATNLPVADLGDSDDLEVGEVVVAIGNPLGLELQRTVTSGIISGLHRSIRISNNHVIEDLIQTDASINNGNSGGPLLNSKGEVIGINTAKIKSAEGLGFSIPINQAKAIVEEVIEHGKYQTVVMGISGVSVVDYQQIFGVKLPVEKGVVLLQVHENTPANKAGLQIGDIITKIDDVQIENMNQLKKTLYKYRKGDKATLTINRTNTILEVEIEFTHIK